MGRIGAILLVVLIVAPVLYLVLSNDPDKMSPIEHAESLTNINIPGNSQVAKYSDVVQDDMLGDRATTIKILFDKDSLAGIIQQCIGRNYKMLPMTDSNEYHNIPGAYYHERSGYYKLTPLSETDERNIQLEILDTIKGELAIQRIVM